MRTVGHMIVLRKVSETKVEIIDPADGKTKRVTFDKALDKISWGRNPPVTGYVWEITP